MWRDISLANKCLLLFGAAIVLIVFAALLAPWLRMNALVGEAQNELSRQLVAAWERADRENPGGEASEAIGVTRISLLEARELAQEDYDIARAIEFFETEGSPLDYQWASWDGTARRYYYVKPVYTATPPEQERLTSLVILDRRSTEAARILAFNVVYLVGAGALVLALAVLVFYLITSMLILEPVRELKQTAELVVDGELGARSQILTGDEFEELGKAFNAMLEHIQRSQDQLRSINTALDLKVGELANANVALFESARLKGEFVANVSHELRTPLNSVIGFAELLMDIANAEANAGDDSTKHRKRVRYLENILTSSRSLLELIDSLLEMAKIQAGRSDIRVETVAVAKVCEALVSLIEPLARRKGIDIVIEVLESLPEIETDPRKLQQILFNFLANAVKFTDPQPGGANPRIIVRAEQLRSSGEDSIRISVIDSGPGIDPEDQERIFEKFQQADSGHTREHGGTGLGLAISKELATLIQAEIHLVSEVGAGSMFSVIVPLALSAERLAETKLENNFRNSLAEGEELLEAGEDGAEVNDQPETADG
ncbi:MAG: sensor histidine kinase [Phycisphaera sp.]|nr:MAG: sensor histidine kinase [Phycisphaera sp.]